MKFKWSYLIYIGAVFLVGIATSSAARTNLVKIIGGEINLTTHYINTTINLTSYEWNGSATSDLDMNGYSIFDNNYLNTSIICLNGNCQSTWGGNSSWNQSYANTLYHPLNQLNSLWTGTLGGGNITGLTNSSLDSTFRIGCTNLTQNGGGSDADFCNDATGSGGGGANVSTTTCSGTQKVSAINNSTGIVTCSSDVDTAYNSSYEYWSNSTLTDLCYNSSYLTSFTESDPLWSGNYSLFNATWSSTYNSTYDVKVSYNTSWNETRGNALYSPVNEPLWSGNYTTYNSTWSSTYNSTYDAKQNDIGSNCADSNYAYGVQNDGTLLCRADLQGSGSGTNYWQVGDGWMFPNITAGGDNDINATNLNASGNVNATSIYVAGLPVLTSYTEIDPRWEANYSLVAFLSNQGSWNVNNSNYWDNLDSPLANWTDFCYNTSYMTNTYNSTYDAKVSDNTTWNESRASTLYHPLNQLNSLWTGTLGFTNLTALPSTCTNQFSTGMTTTSSNCQSVTNTYLASGVFSSITGLGLQSQNLNMGSYNITNATAIGKNSLNITFNATCSIIYGATSILEVC